MDREQLLKDIRCHEAFLRDDEGGEEHCEGCSLKGQLFCADTIFLRASSLISQPRLLTMDEIRETKQAVWLELRKPRLLVSCLVSCETNGKRCALVSGEYVPPFFLDWQVYAKAWRCWSEKPDEWHRKAKWYGI